MINIILEKLDLSKEENCLYLYDILKFRWKNKNIINIKYKCSENFPTFEEHKNLLNSGKYKVFYKIMANDMPIGTIFIDNKDINGTFILPHLLKKALKKYKGQRINTYGKPLSAYIHIELFKLHPEIEIHYASVNPNNKMSLDTLLENGYEFIECILAMKTKNGKVTVGKWA